MALLEREVDRARRMFGMFFEVFSQRGSDFAPALAAHDVIAADCYDAVRSRAPEHLRRPHAEAADLHGAWLLAGDPAARDRPGAAARGKQSVPGDPHPVGSGQPLAAGLPARGCPQPARRSPPVAGERRRGGAAPGRGCASTRWWSPSIAAGTARSSPTSPRCCSGGTATAWGMMEFLAHPGTRALTYRPGGPHPTGWFRVLILAEMMRRMGFPEEAAQDREGLAHPLRSAARPPAAAGTASPPHRGSCRRSSTRSPSSRAARSPSTLWRTRFRFTRDDEARIRRPASRIAAGRLPRDLPPRFFVTASHVALTSGADSRAVSRLVIGHLAALHAGQDPSRRIRAAALAA